MKNIIYNFYFAEVVTGEEFLVAARTQNSAFGRAKQICAEIAANYGNERYACAYRGKVSDYEAEMMGLDEY